jgi:tetraacyldisaccharide 4'-kinase
MADAAGALRDWVPRWWRGEGGRAGAILDRALLPAEAAYRAAVVLRGAAYHAGLRRVHRASIPVVSVGNLAVGGAGKTPVTAWIAAGLGRAGARPVGVLRGYGGDEVLVHRELNPEVPVLVAPRRIDGVEAAARGGCDVAVLDDAFQHRALARDLDVVLVAAESWTPAPRLLPRGGWREGPAALRRADLVVVTRKVAGPERAAAVAAELGGWTDTEHVVRCHLGPGALVPLHDGGAAPPESLDGRAVLAVAGLADPGPFAHGLAEAGAAVELARYPDHHPYSARDAEAISNLAKGRPIVTTRKDAVKLRSLMPPDAMAYVLEQGVELEAGQETLEAALRRVIGR